MDPTVIVRQENIYVVRISQLFSMILEDMWVENTADERCRKQFKDFISWD